MAQNKPSPRRGAPSDSSKRRSPSASTSRASGRPSSGGSARRSRSSTQKRPTAQASKRRASSGRAATRSGSSARKQPGGRARGTVSSDDQNAAEGALGVVKKAKVPLIAAGAAIAGLAGGAALNARLSRRKLLGMKLPKTKGLKKVNARKIPGAVTEAAKRADQFGQRVSSVASSVQTVSETADKAAKKP